MHEVYFRSSHEQIIRWFSILAMKPLGNPKGCSAGGFKWLNRLGVVITLDKPLCNSHMQYKNSADGTISFLLKFLNKGRSLSAVVNEGSQIEDNFNFGVIIAAPSLKA